MKLVFRGHDERYVVEQSLMNLFPGELPVYEPITPGDDSWAVISLEETGDLCRVAVSLCRGGKTTEQTYQEPLSGGDFQREGLRRHAVGACFFLAARAVTGVTPPWGMLTGVRPDKPVTWALEDGKSPEEARAYLEEHYFVTPSRAALALETGATAAKAARRLEKRDIDVYVGIPFCPTRCAYCSFVSQSVERSFALVPPYVDALCGEISAGGEMVRRAGLRVRTFYKNYSQRSLRKASHSLNSLLLLQSLQFSQQSLSQWLLTSSNPLLTLQVLLTHQHLANSARMFMQA